MSILSVLAVLSSCRSGNLDEPNNEIPDSEYSIAFTSSAGSSSRARSASRAVEGALSDMYPSFAVYGFKQLANDTEQNVFILPSSLPYEVVWTSTPTPGYWHYDIISDTRRQSIKYWDFAATRYDFRAVAPFHFVDPETGNVTSMVAAPYSGAIDPTTHTISINNIVGNIYRSQGVDWLTAAHQRDYDSEATPKVTDTDLLDPAEDIEQPTELNDIVKLRFHHILPQVEFRIYSSTMPMSIKEVKIELVHQDPVSEVYLPSKDLVTRASFVHNGTAPKGADFTLSSNASDRASLLLHYEDNIEDLYDDINAPVCDEPTERYEKSALIVNPLLQIPQDVTGLQIKVEVYTDFGKSEGVFSFPEGWESEKRYIYYLAVSEANIIMMDVDVETFWWKDGNDLDIDDPFINW